MSTLKRVGEFFLSIIVALYAFIVSLMPIGGFAFLGVVIAAASTVALAHFGIGQAIEPLALRVLSYDWKIYLGMVAFVMIVMTTATFQHCCVGMNTFVGHLKHAGQMHWENLFVALGWPGTIYVVDRNLRGWLMSWTLFALGALEYYLITVWKGTRFETWNLRTGEITEDYVKPKE